MSRFREILFFRHDVVRDLAWVMLSPGLLDSVNFAELISRPSLSIDAHPIITDEECYTFVQQNQAWLTQLDNDPAPLQDWLEARTSHRLGYYFESLVEYWLVHLYQNGFIAKHVQVQRGKQTLGEYDFLFAAPQATQLQHWEVAVKFYLYHQTDAGLERWYGPQTRDRLDLKLTHLLLHQTALSLTREGYEKIAQLGFAQVVPKILLKGYLFYPADKEWQAAPHQNRGIASGHLRGWWTPVDDLHIPQHHTDSRWTVIPRLRWLSPVVVGAEGSENLIAAQDLERYLHKLLSIRAEPVLLAELAPTRADVWQEISRGFIVNAGWPESSQLSSRQPSTR